MAMTEKDIMELTPQQRLQAATDATQMSVERNRQLYPEMYNLTPYPSLFGETSSPNGEGSKSGTDDYDYIMQHLPKPTPPNPNAQIWQRNAASIGEGLKSLAEIYGQHRGAHLRERQPTENDKAEKYIQYVNQKFDADNKEYQNAIMRLKMAQQARADAKAEKAADREYEDKQYNQRKQEERNFTLKLYGIKEDDKRTDTAQKQEYQLKLIAAREASAKRINASRQGTGNKAVITISNSDGSRQATMTQNQYKVVAADIYQAMRKANFPPIVKTVLIKDPKDWSGKKYIKETVQVTNPSSQQIQDYVSGYIDELGDNVWDYLNVNNGVSTTTKTETKTASPKNQSSPNFNSLFQ